MAGPAEATGIGAMTTVTGLALLKPEQASAAEPQAHAWVAASAGTGKTQVLSARVLRLLLQGTPPHAILCLTFTKLAAAEMQTRVFGRLAHWARCSDAELVSDLQALRADDSPRCRHRRGGCSPMCSMRRRDWRCRPSMPLRRG